MGERRSEVVLRRRCRRLLRELGMRPPLSVEALAERFAEHRRRPIFFEAYPLPIPGPSAVTFAEPGGDVVFYQAVAGKALSRHYMTHELAHLLLDHDPRDVHDIHLADRTVYVSPAEWEAETVATIILEWSMIFDELPRRLPASPALERVQRAFTLHRRGWM